jgi:hypothetical protein
VPCRAGIVKLTLLPEAERILAFVFDSLLALLDQRSNFALMSGVVICDVCETIFYSLQQVAIHGGVLFPT